MSARLRIVHVAIDADCLPTGTPIPRAAPVTSATLPFSLKNASSSNCARGEIFVPVRLQVNLDGL